MNNKLNLSERQKQILDFIKQSSREKGYPPSVREIGQAVGLKSSSTVHAHLVRLEEKGFLRRDPAKPRAIIPLDNEPLLQSEALSVPVVGNVAAGSPILAEQNIDNYLSVPVDFLGSGNHFILKVKGDSMIEAGILDGDYLIVREQADASNGEIVVALLDNEATVKRYYKWDDYVELRPENASMDSIMVNDVQIAGKVAGLLRRI
ncbi:MAG: transcriptional repressor LexA [Syntrophomonas sp.]|uniref:transcriptional repressor LexA n=1 Tax=Syntrophomonas sp. TaxID=2053627 RepID=UPI0026189AF1|nr:transcriptional repressor LexA [Syntrophomonas sp.]MDD2509941.1 transcriptional repressor LexA [Syntrophomonas sp.]MDD3880118.1 transcriptional repressor LexA [Syntrophomonas sp.]MDD4626021.1 transcriptional repressor LexA [Syntrophomonas sp.]